MRNTQLVGILNLTPDSFSDGGLYDSANAALDGVKRMWDEGADVIDIGAESTRPGATPLSSEEEWQRLQPVLEKLPSGTYSIDTRHSETSKKALNYNVSWINDVSGFSQLAMVEAVKHTDCKLVFMHSLSIPADKTIVLPESADVMDTLGGYALKHIKILESSGIAPGRLIFDPGIGFGKTAAQSMTILRRTDEFKSLGIPLLIGHSRKSFLGNTDRDEATLRLSRELIRKGVDYLRVHDVAAHKKLLEEAHA